MQTRVRVEIDGKPVPKERPRKGKNGVMYTPKRTKDYERRVRDCYVEQSGVHFGEEPLDARILVYFEIPKSVSKKKRMKMLSGEIRPVKRPDTDNLVKSVLDAVNGVAYNDDAQIVDCQVRKFYGGEWKTVLVLQEVSDGKSEQSRT